MAILNSIPYDVLTLLGWCTLILVCFGLLNGILFRVIKGITNGKIPVYKAWTATIKSLLQKLTKFFRQYHMAFGIVALLTGITHGYLLTGFTDLDTGMLPYSALVLMGISGPIMKTKRFASNYKMVRKVHGLIACLFVIFAMIHILPKVF
jgi:hypothetical protein